MQERIDQVNRVLREQITGIRVVRAFVREPQEARRFAEANEDLTEVSLRAGRLMSSMFPTVNLLINLSSVAVLWFGASRVNSGRSRSARSIAYLSYLVQILMSVVMATFMVSMIPRASVSADRIQEVLDTDPSVVPPAEPVREVVTHGALEFARRGLPLSRRRAPGARPASPSRPRPAGRPRSSGAPARARRRSSTSSCACSTAPRARCCVGGVDVHDLDPDVLWSTIGLVPQRPYLFSGTVASNLQFGKPDATEDEMWAALEVAQAADFVRAMPGGLDARIEQGGTNVSGGQRQRLVDRPGAGSAARHLRVRRLVLGARPRDRRPAACRARPVHQGLRRRHRGAAGVDHRDAPTTSSCSKTAWSSDAAPHDELLRDCPTYAEIVQSQIGEKSAAA